MDLAGTPTVTTLHGKVGSVPTTHKAVMRWDSPDSLAVDIPLHSDETALATIELPGRGSHTLTPVCLPYSPEFEPTGAERGAVSLEQLARITGGLQRVDLPGISSQLPRQPRLVPVAHWLLIVAISVLLLEVLERRTGALGMLGSLLSRRRFGTDHVQPAVVSPATLARTSAPQTSRPAHSRPLSSGSIPAVPPGGTPAPPPAEPLPSEGNLADALRQATRRASHRRPAKDA
jgi:hypothetical protein